MAPDTSLLSVARAAAQKTGLDAPIVCAVIEQESGWDCHAMRYEGAFRARYVAPLGLPPTEEIARSISWGLMQVMGQVAREHGFNEKFLSAMCEPELGVSTGCEVLAAKLAIADRASRSGCGDHEPGSQCMPACAVATLGCITIGSDKGRNQAMQPALDPEAQSELRYRRALQLWNGGANPDYAEQVMQRVWRYR